MERAYLFDAHLEATDLRRIRLDSAKLENVVLSDGNHISPQIADIQWGNVNLAVVEWSQMKMLGDEQQARQKSKAVHLKEYEHAVRANRQLAVVLQTQGLNEDTAVLLLVLRCYEKRFYVSKWCKQVFLSEGASSIWEPGSFRGFCSCLLDMGTNQAEAFSPTFSSFPGLLQPTTSLDISLSHHYPRLELLCSA